VLRVSLKLEGALLGGGLDQGAFGGEWADGTIADSRGAAGAICG
jgi:hypothetical protein